MAKTDMYNGHIFGDWQVIGRFDSKKVVCKCTVCGFEKNIAIYSLEKGDTKYCSNHRNTDIKEHTMFGEWEVIGKSKEFGKLICKCSCGTVKDVSKARLLEGRTKSCGHGVSKRLIDISNKIINNMEVLEYVGDRGWKCECIDCGDIRIISGNRLRNNVDSVNCTKCSGIKKESIKDKIFGEWTVVDYIANGKWLCKCSCGTLREIRRYELESGNSKSCGHDTTGYKDIVDKKFGMLTVLSRYEQSRYYVCKCDCNNITLKHKHYITNSENPSCGCNSLSKIINTKLSKYGEVCPQKVCNPRDIWQIETLLDCDKLKEFIVELGYKPSITELSALLGVNNSNICKRLKQYNLYEYVDIHGGTSKKERDLFEFISSIYYGEIKTRDKSTINPYELDIYIPDKKLAFEFNGNYWHSTLFKNKKYHQNKTIACAKQGIHLVHIFEYEWDDSDTREKLKAYIRGLIISNNINIYARNTDVTEINNNELAKNFIDKYHLQCWVNSNIVIGSYYKGELISIMTFGKPRFNSNCDYELLRFCSKQGYNVVGAFSKMLKYFISRYSVDSIVSYVDISKFTGNSYLKSGFKAECVTEPSYVWISCDDNDVLSRYQTQKHKLLDSNLGSVEQTEDDIMYNLRYYKIYNCGNIRLEWRKK